MDDLNIEQPSAPGTVVSVFGRSGPAVVAAQDDYDITQIHRGRFEDVAFVVYTSEVSGGAAPSGLPLVEDYQILSGDRILVLPYGGAATKPGIWIAAAGTWTRATDCDTAAEWVHGREVKCKNATSSSGRVTSTFVAYNPSAFAPGVGSPPPSFVNIMTGNGQIVELADGVFFPFTAKGDLVAGIATATPGPTNYKLGTVLGVGANGQVLVADSTQTTGLKWADAGSVGGPGALRAIGSVNRTAGNISFNQTSMSFEPTSTLELVLAAVAGDVLEVCCGLDKQGGAGGSLGIDIAIVDPTNSNAIIRYLSSGTSTPSTQGIGGGWYSGTGLQYDQIEGQEQYTIVGGDITGGTIKIRLYGIVSSGTVVVTGSAGIKARLRAKVFKAPA